MKKFLKLFIAASLIMGTLVNSGLVFAADENCGDFYEKTNFALTGTASAIKSPIPYWGPDKLNDGIINRDASKPDQSRWSSEEGAPAWVKIDLKETKSFQSFLIAFENEKVQKFHIEASDDDQTYTTIYTSDQANGHDMDTTIKLDQAVTARYVKLTIDVLRSDAYPSVSIYEFAIYDSNEVFYHNIATDAKATASDMEASTVAAGNVNDGIFKTRWGSNTSHGEKWVILAFDDVRTIHSLILEWERCNATGYKIQADINGEWQTLRTLETPKSFTDKLNFKNAVQTQRIRIVIDDFFNQAPNREGKEINYPSVSLHEVQLYDKELVLPPKTAADIANDIQLEPVTEDDVRITMPEVPAGFSVKFIGADYEQIVDRELNIIRPLTAQEVNVNFEVTEDATGKKANSPAITIMVPGLHQTADSINKKPEVLPELQQWYGYEGEFSIKDTTTIIVDPSAEEFMDTAQKFAADYKDIMKKEINIKRGSDPQSGDFYFAKSQERLDKETYIMDVNDYIKIEAGEQTGAYWSTRTILQILKQTGHTIPKGITKDYPKYKVRGMMLDVARKSFSLDFLKELVKTYSWYKLNEFHVHLNDNVFTQIDVGDGKKTPEYSGFRLESDIANLTNTDLYYTKKEFNQFISESQKFGVNITPEFDSPGHSGAFTRARPDLARGNEMEYLDVENPETIKFIKQVFAEYTSGENPVYPKGTVVHVGTDEYKRGNKEAFRKYQDELLKFVRDEQGYTPRVWGSQSENNGTTPITVDGVQMNLWYTGYANPRQMYELGYDLINTNDGDLYIVPGAGYYHDYLNQNHIYSSWEPNIVDGFTIPAGDKQMLGSTFAVWNDRTGPTLDNGTTDQEVFDRIYAILPTFSAKLWGDITDYSLADINRLKENINFAPNSNPTYQVDSVSGQILDYNFNNDKGLDQSGNEYHLADQKNVSYDKGIHRNALSLKGGSSYVQTPLHDLGYNANLDFWVKRDSNSNNEEQILFESELGAIKAVQKDTGNFGFSRDIRDYSFNYTLPKDEWVHIRLETQFTRTNLYVNDEKVDTLADNATGKKWATLIMPLQRIGSKTNSFVGQIDDVSVYKQESKIKATATSEETVQSANGAEKAVDGDPNTMWHTEWSSANTLPHSITMELPEATEIKGFTYLPRNSGDNGIITKYTIETSIDNETFDKVAEGEWAMDNTMKQVDFDMSKAKFIRLTALDGFGGYASAAEINIIRDNNTLNKRALREAIDDAKDMIESGSYTPDSITMMQNVLLDAQNTLETALTQEELDDACAKVDAAILAMMKLADKTALLALIEAAKEIDEDLYTEETIQELLSAIDNAETVIRNDNASQEIVNNAAQRLQDAIDHLVLNSEATIFTKTLLLNAINKANAAEESGQLKYLAPSVKKLILDARDAAVKVYDDENATIAEVMEAWMNLADAMHYMNFVANKEALQTLVDTNKDLDMNDYKEGVEAFNTALANAKAVLADDKALQARIDEAYKQLYDAVQGLVEKDKADKKYLEMIVTSIKEHVGDGSKYKKDANWDTFVKALSAAENVLADDKATQEDVEKALSALTGAYEDIRLEPTEDQLDELNSFVDKASSINRSLYTNAQLKQIDTLVAEAKSMLKDFDSEKYGSLLKKMEDTGKLIDKVENKTPSKPSINGDAGTIKPSAKPDTSDTTNTAGILFTLLLSGYGLCLIRNKRIKDNKQ